MMNGVVSIKSGIVEYYFDYISESFCFNALQHKQGKTFTSSTRVLQKILSLGSDYFRATFYQTYFYYKLSKYSPFTETRFCKFFTQSRKTDK